MSRSSASPTLVVASKGIVSPLFDPALRRKAKQFSRLIRRSAVSPIRGKTHRPVLAANGETALTFIGHSGFFIQLGGLNLVVDPNFALWLFILKRQRRPGLRIKDLPAVDVTLVTHAHFDHLHRPSLRAIAQASRRKGGRPVIVVPSMVRDLVCDLGFSEVVELEWWQEFRLGDFSAVMTPARHRGARVIQDHQRGFGGYVLRGRQHNIYHAGDTAYFNGFREIGRRLGPDLALLPIGAYDPPSFRNVHASPADAVQGFLDLGARYMVPMHYGSFRLSHEPMDEPLRLLAEEARRHRLYDQVIVMEEGVTQFF